MSRGDEVISNFRETEIGSIPVDWNLLKLSDVAKIIVSNVDKKNKEDESPVLLCNYLDVYQNEYITSGLDFMRGSASKAEIDKFFLNRGDVLVTKDSETAEDIASAAVVVDTIPNLLCGYHLAIIRPEQERMDSYYLAKILQHKKVHNQFVVKANGVTRYGLTFSVINNAIIPVPPTQEQFEIARILTTWDRAIERTQRLIEEKKRLKKGLMQGLLSGKLRFPEFGRTIQSAGDIPSSWKPYKLSSIVNIINGGTPSRNKPEYWGGDIPWIAVGDFSRVNRHITATKEFITNLGFHESSTNLLQPGNLIISARGTVGAVAQLSKQMAFNQTSYGLQANPEIISNDFLFYLLRQFNYRISEIAHGAIFDTITRDSFDYVKLLVPGVQEQKKITEILTLIDDSIELLEYKLTTLQVQLGEVRDKLLTGLIRVKVY